MKRIRDKIINGILCAALVIGAGLLAYPSFSDYWNNRKQNRSISEYTAIVAAMDNSEYDRLISEAEEYNRMIAEKGILWSMDEEQLRVYDSILHFNQTGNMGYVDIPKMGVRLPVYHGTDDLILQTSIGHLAGSSFPVGGEGSNCILTGHRGLPSARLFTDLDKVQEGDTWTLNILNETLTYECDRVLVVEPDDLSSLQIEKGKDYCTLVTCTPYGVNTHRLLVRGHRINNAQGDARVIADAIQIEAQYVAPFLAVPILVSLMLLILAVPGKKTQGRTGIDGTAGIAEARKKKDRKPEEHKPEDQKQEDQERKGRG